MDELNDTDLSIQELLEAMGAKDRRETMQKSDQLVLGELTILMDNVDGEKPVVFDDVDCVPTSVGSWRGSYRELAIRYDGGSEPMTVDEFHAILDDADGKTFKGYKGGDFTMSSTTPVWVANRGTSSGFKHREHGVVGVREEDERVVIETGEVPF
jgi:hypothetical protein